MQITKIAFFTQSLQYLGQTYSLFLKSLLKLDQTKKDNTNSNNPKSTLS
ncbi:hypothetical protein B6N60_05104 [Richelia sinica FACHB-800]|uniref:Uncharacterized protein n=1 Tax=Richelia sinica FACHB-800 TaxID=1357546 RepID=A0A975TCN7_9NOST|nr:hypothetical protein B6N60_05104 [Richelia sinica FACHB-800]